MPGVRATSRGTAHNLARVGRVREGHVTQDRERGTEPRLSFRATRGITVVPVEGPAPLSRGSRSLAALGMTTGSGLHRFSAPLFAVPYLCCGTVPWVVAWICIVT